MLQTTGTITHRRPDGPALELTLASSELARRLQAGQAVLLRAGWGDSPYLRRTFYPVAIEGDTWTLRVPADGDWAHAWLRAAPVGSEVDLLGPVGNGYTLAPGARNVLLLGEDNLAWILLPAVHDADRRGLSVSFVHRARSPRDNLPATRLPPAAEYLATTPANGDGFGTALPDLLRWADAVLLAGSLTFYRQARALMRQVRYGVQEGFAQVLYPAPVLCGTGACQACVAEIGGARRRVCLRGPVMDLDALGTD